MSAVELVEEVVDISSLHISVENPTTFEDLPEKWLIPLPSVKLLCKEGRPLELGTGGFGMVYRSPTCPFFLVTHTIYFLQAGFCVATVALWLLFWSSLEDRRGSSLKAC